MEFFQLENYFLFMISIVQNGLFFDRNIWTFLAVKTLLFFFSHKLILVENKQHLWNPQKLFQIGRLKTFRSFLHIKTVALACGFLEIGVQLKKKLIVVPAWE